MFSNGGDHVGRRARALAHRRAGRSVQPAHGCRRPRAALGRAGTDHRRPGSRNRGGPPGHGHAPAQVRSLEGRLEGGLKERDRETGPGRGVLRRRRGRPPGAGPGAAEGPEGHRRRHPGQGRLRRGHRLSRRRAVARAAPPAEAATDQAMAARDQAMGAFDDAITTGERAAAARDDAARALDEAVLARIAEAAGRSRSQKPASPSSTRPRGRRGRPAQTPSTRWPPGPRVPSSCSPASHCPRRRRPGRPGQPGVVAADMVGVGQPRDPRRKGAGQDRQGRRRHHRQGHGRTPTTTTSCSTTPSTRRRAAPLPQRGRHHRPAAPRGPRPASCSPAPRVLRREGRLYAIVAVTTDPWTPRGSDGAEQAERFAEAGLRVEWTSNAPLASGKTPAGPLSRGPSPGQRCAGVVEEHSRLRRRQRVHDVEDAVHRLGRLQRGRPRRPCRWRPTRGSSPRRRPPDRPARRPGGG